KWRMLDTHTLSPQGGSYPGDEGSPVERYREALGRGATLLAAEWGSEAARTLAHEGAPLILSHHDFHGMIDDAELERMAGQMAALNPIALKIVPTAPRAADGVRMLEWTRRAGDGEPRRAGFAMGAPGLPRRVLSFACG